MPKKRRKQPASEETIRALIAAVLTEAPELAFEFDDEWVLKCATDALKERSRIYIDGINSAVDLDFTEAIHAGARTTGASKRLSLHDLRQMSLAVKERIRAYALRVEAGCCNCDDGWFLKPDDAPGDPFERNRCTCSCHKRETTR